MHLPSASLCGLLLLLKLQLCATRPISSGLTDADLDLMKVILNRLEEAVSEQRAPSQGAVVDSLSAEAGQQPEAGLSEAGLSEAGLSEAGLSEAGLSEAEIRELLSAKNLKSVRNDSSRRSSGCFGRRMDRIGSMSSLGCNTVSRHNPK